jgi:hypothetical protein
MVKNIPIPIKRSPMLKTLGLGYGGGRGKISPRKFNLVAELIAVWYR